MSRLEGKIALITGTARGQGRAAALRFASEGASIVGCDVLTEDADETVKMVTDAGGTMVSRAPIDLTDESQVASWIDFAVSEFGDFDILYNNASAARFKPTETMTLEEWNFTLANELTLVFLATKHAIPVFRRKGSGCIVNTASVAGLGSGGGGGGGGGIGGGLAHAVTKAGVIQMTRLLASELADLNVRVNSIAPGMVDTPGARASMMDDMGIPKEMLDALMSSPAVIQPDDIARAALFLCSEDGAHINGNNLTVDSGAMVGAMKMM
jgi:meso-butanediol dehydrogenase / (S,S)-butanediol dehydrogenase / diacetyl reductase